MTEAYSLPIQGISEWMPFWKGCGLLLATFVLEDAAAIGAGLLLANGSISWPVAFMSCWLGIWFGDAGLYTLSRFGGRSWFEHSSFKKLSSKVARSEKWFSEHGTMILIFSRCVPGARLPTYLAAGFLRLPWLRFLIVTGLAAAVWTLLVLSLTKMIGVKLISWLGAYQHGVLVLIGAGMMAFILLQLLRRIFGKAKLERLSARIESWRRWEFWPAWLFYPPVGVYCLWLAIKYRGLAVATAANPGIFSGGLVGESKMATLKNLQETSGEFVADAALISGPDFMSRVQALEKARSTMQIEFPFILKPDVGQRGAGVRLIHRQAQTDDYLRQNDAPLVVQRYAPGPLEAGIFYYRFPREPRGKIFAITEKIFPVITGDGKRTIGHLIEADRRARIIAKKYLRRFAARLNEILPLGDTLRLVEAGNHAQGCIFRDGARLITPQLEARIDDISRKLEGFFIGRYDVRFQSEDDLCAGMNFKIIELNGAASEATNIYDARNSLWQAYRTLFRQWDLVFAIGAENRQRGVRPMSPFAVWRAWREYIKISATYPAAD